MFKKMFNKIFSKNKDSKRGSTLSVVVITILSLSILASTAFKLTMDTQTEVNRALDSGESLNKAKATLIEAGNVFHQKMTADSSGQSTYIADIKEVFDVHIFDVSNGAATSFKLYKSYNEKYLTTIISFASDDSGDNSINNVLFSEEAKIGEIFNVDNMSTMYLSEDGFLPARDYATDRISTVPSDVDTVNEAVSYIDSSCSLLVDNITYIYGAGSNKKYIDSNGNITSNINDASICYETGTLGGKYYYDYMNNNSVVDLFYNQYTNDDARFAMMFYLALSDANITASAYANAAKAYSAAVVALETAPSWDWQLAQKQQNVITTKAALQAYDDKIVGSFSYILSESGIKASEFDYQYISEEKIEQNGMGIVSKRDKHCVDFDYNYVSYSNGTTKQGNLITNFSSDDFAILIAGGKKFESICSATMPVNTFIRNIFQKNYAAFNTAVYPQAKVNSAYNMLTGSTLLRSLVTQRITNTGDYRYFKNVTFGALTYNSTNDNYLITTKFDYSITGWFYPWSETLTFEITAEELYNYLKVTYKVSPIPISEVDLASIPFMVPSDKVGAITESKSSYIVANYAKYLMSSGLYRTKLSNEQLAEIEGKYILGIKQEYFGQIIEENANNGVYNYDGELARYYKFEASYLFYYQDTVNSTEVKHFEMPRMQFYIYATSQNASYTNNTNTRVILNNYVPTTAIYYVDRNNPDQNSYGTNLACIDGNIYESTTDISRLNSVSNNLYFNGDVEIATGSINVSEGSTLYINGNLEMSDTCSLNMEIGSYLIINGDFNVSFRYSESSFDTLKSKGVDINASGATIIVDGDFNYRGIKVKPNLLGIFLGTKYEQGLCDISCNGNESNHNSDPRSPLDGIFVINGDLNFISEGNLYSNPIIGATFYIDGCANFVGLWTAGLYDLCRPNFVFAKSVRQPSVAWANVYGDDLDFDFSDWCNSSGYLFMICEDVIDFSQLNFASVNVYSPYDVMTQNIEADKAVKRNITQYISKENVGNYTEEDIDTWGLPSILRQGILDAFVRGDFQTEDHLPGEE